MSDTAFVVRVLDRSKWRDECKERVNQCEHSWVEDLKYCRSRRKERVTAPSSHPFNRCSVVCRSAIGLLSHQQVHDRQATMLKMTLANNNNMAR